MSKGENERIRLLKEFACKAIVYPSTPPMASDSAQLRPYTLPLEWLSSRPSNPKVLLRRHKNGGPIVNLISAMKPGDEVRKVESPRESWRQLAGRSGYARPRGGKPVGMVVLRLN